METKLYQQKWYMEYLQYQLHVLASTLAVIRLEFNISRDYTIRMVYSGEGGDEISFPPSYSTSYRLYSLLIS
jgi:hypothetical protein